MSFNPYWLKAALARAAGKAGYPAWSLTDDLVEGITFYFRQDYAGSVIDLPKLEKIVRGVLCDVGYGEVAVRFQTGMPCYHISLAQCLRELSQNDRAEFFEKLGSLIAGLHAAKVQHFHFSDLHACVRGLKSIHPAAQIEEDQPLLNGVISFVRERVQSLHWRREVWCSIS